MKQELWCNIKQEGFKEKEGKKWVYGVCVGMSERMQDGEGKGLHVCVFVLCEYWLWKVFWPIYILPHFATFPTYLQKEQKCKMILWYHFRKHWLLGI